MSYWERLTRAVERGELNLADAAEGISAGLHRLFVLTMETSNLTAEEMDRMEDRLGEQPPRYPHV